jgi:AcrR family transcriptional regulator
MARPKSEEKRNTLLSVAAQVFAKNGLSASTASITNAAGMAEGTLFNYFKGKDDLMNTLYVEIKNDLAQSMLSGKPKSPSPRDVLHHIWCNYVSWGAQNPDRLAVLHKLKVWEGLRPEIPESTTACFNELQRMVETAMAAGELKNVPYEFMLAIFSSNAETVMNYIKQDPDKARVYTEQGFELYWSGIAGSEKDETGSKKKSN